ncbi:MAG: DUF4410 domain-containing protein [Deltaproteobacteria bacterium]|nr:DUF4410 domain-containing protein [Deltaproteobacteria bacterium]
MPFRIAAALTALTLFFGCASSKVQGVRDFTPEAPTSQPPRILIYDFVADLPDVNPDELKEQREVTQSANDAMADQLVKRIREMGMMALRVADDVRANPGDLLIEGRFVEIDKGNMFTRNLIGFGVGSTEMVSQAQVLRSRYGEKQLLFDLRAVAKGKKMPGLVAPLLGGVTLLIVAASAIGVAGEIAGPVEQDGIRMADAIADELAAYSVEHGWLPAEAIER